jgi:hypothetical protein
MVGGRGQPADDLWWTAEEIQHHIAGCHGALSQPLCLSRGQHRSLASMNGWEITLATMPPRCARPVGACAAMCAQRVRKHHGRSAPPPQPSPHSPSVLRSNVQEDAVRTLWCPWAAPLLGASAVQPHLSDFN